MMKRLNLKGMAVLLAALAGFSPGASALELLNTKKDVVIDDASLNVDGRLQLFGHGQIVKDPVRNDGRLYLFIKQARLRFHGNVEKVKYDVQLAFAGEDEVKTGQNASLNLLDYSFDVPLFHESLWLKVGQFKAPYSRERLTNGGQQLFADRSFNNLAFRVGRDVGGAVYARGEKLAGTVGVFTAGGRDVPERYLPEKLGFPLAVLRAGYDDGIDQDLFDLDATIGQTDRVKKAVYANALWLHDTAIGHNVVLGLKTSEIPLLLNKNWNPYLGQGAPDNIDRGNLVQAGGDAVIKAPLCGGTFMASVEGNYGAFSNKYGRIELTGGTGTVGVAKSNVELAARYAYLLLDRDMTPGSGKKIITGRKPLQELTPSITYHIRKGRSKVILDLPILFNVPVVVEKGLGTYVLVPEQPDQTTVVNTKPGSYFARRTVVEGRMIYQLSF
jgi:hypothetical protein